MSYILEALADSEQARQQTAAVPRHSLLPVVDENMPRQRVWPYALAGTLLLNAAVLSLWLRPALPGSAAVSKSPTVPQAAETPLAAPEPRVASLAGSGKPAADVAEIVFRETRLPPFQPERASDRNTARLPAPADAIPGTVSVNSANDGSLIPMPKLSAPRAKAKPSAGVAVALAGTPDAIASVAAPAAVATAAAPIQRAAAGGIELPPALQQELPALSVAGFIRGEGSGSMVIVNDRLVREGDEVAPGVKLEKILGDNLVFNYKGYRFKR